jgi:hypothetical protein
MGYLRLAGEDIVRRVTVPLIKRESHIEAFVPRTLSAEAITPALAASAAPSVRRPALDADAILNASRHHSGLK